jgi:hypothetical protein
MRKYFAHHHHHKYSEIYLIMHEQSNIGSYLGTHRPIYNENGFVFAKTSGKRVNNSLVFNNKSSKSIAPDLSIYQHNFDKFLNLGF